ncbi:MAG TPA: protein kinase [Thermoanaerobaculia bacterium]|nr:protein kinase [Thermoanaerobaculia bacterium]
MIGSTLAQFRITAKLGEGGMGEVWRAEDTRLGREVAIKVLPERFLADPERLARFEREARVLASLSHPNVAGLFEVGEARVGAVATRAGTEAGPYDDRGSSSSRRGGAPSPPAGGEAMSALPATPPGGAGRGEGSPEATIHYLVMELVEGETLAERIGRGALLPGEVLPIALQIAAALEAAHERGIVHRDLKPANVKVEPGGKVKVLDFGLAKALEPEPGSSAAASLAHSPTLTYQATQAGVLMGTAAYMSPEQARGQAADRRADIWAFGVVLYEMLTGRMAFPGDTVSDTLASVLKTDTDWALLPPTVHPEVRRLLQRCLEKDADRRLHDVADARVVLADAVAGRLPQALVAEGAARPAAQRRWGAPVAAALAGAALAAGASWLARPAPSPPPLRKTEIAYAGAAGLRASRVGPAISPDGRWVAYGDEGLLWLRDFESAAAREVPGGAGAARPFWSPDSRWLGFAVGDRLWKAPVGGGSPTAIAKLPEGLDVAGGLAWLSDGRIVFTTGNSGLLSVSDQGGDPKPLLEAAEGELDFHFAAPLPGARGVVFVVHRDGGMDTLSLYAMGERRQLLQLPGDTLDAPAYSPTGHLLYERQTTNPGIWALPFSLADLEVTGEPFLVVPNAGVPDVSQEGTLVYVAGSEARLTRLAWVDRQGQRLGEIGSPQDQVVQPVLSPDGKRLALLVSDGGRRDLWIHDTERGTRTRLTFDEALETWPEWSPDGRQVIYSVGQGGQELSLHVKAADGTGTARALGHGVGGSFTRDGTGIVYAALDPETSWDLWLRSPMDGEATRLVQEEAAQFWPRVAPGGDYLAYASSESGRDEVYLTRFPDGTGKWQVSVAGGDWPQWSGDGSRLYYIQPGSRAVMEVEVTVEPALSLGQPRELFAAPASGIRRPFGWPDGFAVTPDGERFVVVEPAEQVQSIPGISVVQSWFAEFRRR